MKTLQELAQAGIDVEDAMERFMDNEEMFRMFLRKLLEDSTYRDMLDAIAIKDVEQAFEAAHHLKGTVANLSISKVYAQLYDIVEMLRYGNIPSKVKLQQFEQTYESVLTAIKAGA